MSEEIKTYTKRNLLQERLLIDKQRLEALKDSAPHMLLQLAERLDCDVEMVTVDNMLAVIKELREEEAKYERRIQNADIHRIGARIDEIRLDKIRAALAPFRRGV